MHRAFLQLGMMLSLLVPVAALAQGGSESAKAGDPAAPPRPQTPYGSVQQSSTPGLLDRLRGSRQYAIGIGDVIRVDVFEEPQFDGSAVVRPDGKVSLPLVSEVAIAGLTPAQAEQLLAARLQIYVQHPKVTVTVEEIHSRVVYVTGEVLRPGAYALADQLNVVQLISRAGGTTAYAKKKQVYVLRASSGARIKVDYRKVLQGQRVEENVLLNPGDTVVVP